MTGGLTIGESTATEIPLHVKSAATTGSNYIRFYSNGAIVTDVGYSKDLSTHLYNGNLTSHPTLVLGRTNNLTDGMQFRYSNVYYNVLHAGNYQNYPNTKVGVSSIWLYPEIMMRLTLEVHIQLVVISTLDIIQKIIDQDLLNIILGKMMQVYMGNISSHIYLLAHSRFSVYLLLRARI